ncbi:MAG: LPS export ABC transporter permease LptG [Methylobacteriaceae bacterium]|nr:LPS export ABC transporter permease LptG [Methylobacteriaceae bacterium]
MIGRTLGLYIAARFARTIFSVFVLFFAIIYALDFVELLRRSGDTQGATTSLMAYLSLLRVPTVVEQALPFAVLFGAMTAFLNLSRKLELVIARAAGVSVWQFLAPPLIVVVLIGLVSVMAYNPVAAQLKGRGDELETRIFGKAGRGDVDTGSLWIRQKSMDGQAIIRADRSSDAGTVLASVTAFVFEPDGRFMERVEAATARLSENFWTFADARVISPGEEPQSVKTYLLATTLTPEQVTQSFVSPEAVPFWSLPAIGERIEQVGLDATAYKLHYQTLLARPLLFVAMVLVAASFSLRFFRFGGIARMVSGGVISGFVLYVASKLVADLGGAGLLSAPVAAWSPAVVGSMLGTLVLLHQEDG